VTSSHVSDDAYYWAGGKRIRLQRRDEFAIDVAIAQEIGVAEKQLERFRRQGRELTSALRLIDGSDLPERVRQSLDSVGALQPVYQTDDKSLIVVLPEVRVETTDPTKEDRLYDLVKQSDAVVTEAQRGRFVIRPSSGRGVDALALANRVVEQLKPEVAQARFIHVVPSPDLHRRGST
jgi:hypothetical protein